MKNTIRMWLLGLLTLSLLVSCEPNNNENGENSEGQGRGKDFTETAMEMNLEMVYVEGGTFEMGTTPEQWEAFEHWHDWFATKDWSSYIVRKVKLDSYYIGKYEITKEQWYACMGTKPWLQAGMEGGEGYDLPAYCINWEDASEYCALLSKKTGKKYVLPTEAQWEYAARGGKKSKGYVYSGSDNLGEVAWYNSDRAHPVGLKKTNELGIYDMSGNIEEWCLDWRDTYDETDTDNPQGPVSGTYRVMRGGSFYVNDISRYWCAVATRSSGKPGYRGSDCGFRIAMIL